MVAGGIPSSDKTASPTLRRPPVMELLENAGIGSTVSNIRFLINV